ncbi:MAG: AAA family ATPase [Lachnospiraceae bacterium]|nr:AAA family ATPase [Lachnospiraceae bacterium]
MKVFNTTAVCVPEKHYMVDLSGRVEEIRKLIDAGKYFTINRARQYGKTTTIDALRRALLTDYEVVSLSFEGIGDAGFKTEQEFVKAFARKLKREFRNGLAIPEEIKDQILEFIVRKEEKAELDELFDLLQDWCYKAEKDIVLMIDEVDSATNNQVFLDFLAGLRDNYISRDTKGLKTFRSVILAGVTGVKHLKIKIRDEGGHKENSPWNIAADFTIDMSLSETGIRGMLDEYEADHHTGMDTAAIAKSIRDYTSGYPFLKGAKSAEEVRALLTEARGMKKLSKNELDKVTGGVPEYFDYGGMQLTPSEAMNMIENARIHLGMAFAQDMVVEICGPYYSNVSSEELKDAYSVYGTDLFKRLG